MTQFSYFLLLLVAKTNRLYDDVVVKLPIIIQVSVIMMTMMLTMKLVKLMTSIVIQVSVIIMTMMRMTLMVNNDWLW